MNSSVTIATEAVNGAPSYSNGETGALRSSTAKANDKVERRKGAEYYDSLLWRLSAQWSDPNSAGFLLGLTGCLRNAGVSTLATNLAIRAADHGIGPVLLVDANVRRPQLHRLLKVSRRIGLADVLTGQSTLGELIQRTSFPGLDLLPLGADGSRRNAGTNPAKIEALACDFRESYALVLVDLPPVGELDHLHPLARVLDATLLILRAGRVRRQEAQHALERLAHDDICVLGTVITNQHQYVPRWFDLIV
jgi:Mrp family chromosome partitioning ATPase